MAMLRTGRELGPFLIHERIAVGGFSEVYRARDERSRAEIALKVPSRRGIRQDRDGYKRERKLSAALHHPNVLPILDAGVIDGQPFLAFPLADGPLSLRMRRPVPLPVALNWLTQIMKAVAYVHAERLIHCDIKPSNILVMPNGHLCLADFGSARRGTRTVFGEGSGTAEYMAPEQRRGRPCPRSDLYSVGRIAHELIAGELPPRGWPEHGARVHPRLRLHGLDAWLAKALAEDREQRFRSAEEMLEGLRAVRRKSARAFASASAPRPMYVSLAG